MVLQKNSSAIAKIRFPASRDARFGPSLQPLLPLTITPRFVVRWGTRMSKFNWRSLDDTYYDHVEEAEMTGIAWECLRRNASFQRDHRAAPLSGPSIGDEFRQHWGLVFRC